MSTLAPDLFQLRFDDLMKIGRARIRALAPAWTDYNAHDPGITLMELFAWVAEAQLYSLSRMRRDERAAYAAFLGIETGGTRGASGVIWSNAADPSSPVRTYSATMVLSPDTVINLANTPAPTFRPTDALLWVPGSISALRSRDARGRTTDLTATNARGGLVFLPFGDGAGPGTVLSIDYVCNDVNGLFGVDRNAAKGALWPIGILAAAPLAGSVSDADPATATEPASITATLIANGERFSLRVARDSTEGLLASGALLLDLANVTVSPTEFTIELRAKHGFARPPRWLRIEPSVLPILQGRTVTDELTYAIATPNWSFTLAVPGVRYEAGAEPVIVDVVDADAGSRTTWQRTDDLTDHGPTDTVYEYDASAGQITFGNGVNGRIPPDQAQVLSTYSVSDAEQGNVARNRQWQVAGFQGVMGINLDPVAGGASPPGWIDQRRDARARSVNDHAIVSSDDIVAAALNLPLLEAARAWISTPDTSAPRTGVVTLVAMRARLGPNEPTQAPETTRWLAAIRAQLSPSLPLGTRLLVVGPAYVPFSLTATIQCTRGLDPKTVQSAVEATLSRRLALVAPTVGAMVREPGVGVTVRDLTAWIRSTPGVARVTALQLFDASGGKIDAVTVSGDAFPKWLADPSTISVTRAANGAAGGTAR